MKVGQIVVISDEGDKIQDVKAWAMELSRRYDNCSVMVSHNYADYIYRYENGWVKVGHGNGLKRASMTDGRSFAWKKREGMNQVKESAYTSFFSHLRGIEMKHNLKTKTKYFEDVLGGTKTFECRYNDRDFKVGDMLKLNEIDKHLRLTGRFLEVEVLYILDKFIGLASGYVVMSISEPVLPITTEPSPNQEREYQLPHEQYPPEQIGISPMTSASVGMTIVQMDFLVEAVIERLEKADAQGCAILSPSQIEKVVQKGMDKLNESDESENKDVE